MSALIKILVMFCPAIGHETYNYIKQTKKIEKKNTVYSNIFHFTNS